MIHRGSRGSNDSGGCQTADPSEYPAFIEAATGEKHPQESSFKGQTWHYVLTVVRSGPALGQQQNINPQSPNTTPTQTAPVQSQNTSPGQSPSSQLLPSSGSAGPNTPTPGPSNPHERSGNSGLGLTPALQRIIDAMDSADQTKIDAAFRQHMRDYFGSAEGQELLQNARAQARQIQEQDVQQQTWSRGLSH
jgi:hypothetical protein